MTLFLRIPLSLLPVILFLAALLAMDSFRLLSKRALAWSLAAGAAAALLSLLVNRELLSASGLGLVGLRRYGAPVTEEILKGAFIVYLIRSHRTGFLVDSAIHGFAVGTGFALVENLYYVSWLEEGGPIVWIARGFGTAILHSSTMVIFAILSKTLTDRRDSGSLHLFLPGFGTAIVIHSVYNHVPIHPLAMAAILLFAMPLLVLAVFQRSEEATRQWLGLGFDTEVEILELVMSGEIRESRIGTYLAFLKDRFPGPVVADMLCLLQTQLELSIRAKSMLMAREAGINIPVGEDERAKLRELGFLEESIGKTGLLALNPVLRRGRKDLWQLYMLKQ